MRDYSSNGEVYGTKVLNAAIIAVAVAILLGSITSPAPKAAVARAPDRQVAEQVVAPGHHG